MEFDERLTDRKKWWNGDRCSALRTLDLLGTKTVFLVLRECFYGTTRFEDFVEWIEASAPAVSRALKQLEAAQIVVRVPYQDPGRRIHDEYRLTEKGEDLLPVLLALVQWGDKYMQSGRPPLSFVEEKTGRELRVRVGVGSSERSIRSDEIGVRLPRKPRRE
ncbi:MAG: winged helix-turn-helix transcriptional regulator [Candidatus Nanopelagicales bacterium]